MAEKNQHDLLTADEARELLREALYKSGLSQAEWCRKYKVGRGRLYLVLSRKARLSSAMLGALGLRRVEAYEQFEVK